jgi:hypothetical protein
LATNNKDFEIKNGIVVRGNTATVAGNTVLTTASAINQSQLTTSVSSKSANYSIVAADRNSIIGVTAAATITIDNVLSVGERIDFIQTGAGQITFAAGSGVTLNSKGSLLKTAAQYSGATVICSASGIYTLIGDIA